MERSELEQAVVSWNKRFPLDRWWRNKHEVAFMSPVHRESSFLYQLFEFEEDKLFSKAITDSNVKDNKDVYIPGSGDIFKTSATIEDFTKEAQREIDEILKMEDNGQQTD